MEQISPLKKSSKGPREKVHPPFELDYAKGGPETGMPFIPDESEPLPVPGILPEDPTPAQIPR